MINFERTVTIFRNTNEISDVSFQFFRKLLSQKFKKYVILKKGTKNFHFSLANMKIIISIFFLWKKKDYQFFSIELFTKQTRPLGKDNAVFWTSLPLPPILSPYLPMDSPQYCKSVSNLLHTRHLTQAGLSGLPVIVWWEVG